RPPHSMDCDPIRRRTTERNATGCAPYCYALASVNPFTLESVDPGSGQAKRCNFESTPAAMLAFYNAAGWVISPAPSRFLDRLLVVSTLPSSEVVESCRAISCPLR